MNRDTDFIIFAVVAFIFLTIWQAKRFMSRLHRLPTMKTEELKALFKERRNFSLFIRATEELQKRGEDTSFTYAYFLELAVSRHSGEQLFGWTGLKSHFPEKLEGFDLSEGRPSRKTVAKLRELHEKQE